MLSRAFLRMIFGALAKVLGVIKESGLESSDHDAQTCVVKEVNERYSVNAESGTLDSNEFERYNDGILNHMIQGMPVQFQSVRDSVSSENMPLDSDEYERYNDGILNHMIQGMPVHFQSVRDSISSENMPLDSDEFERYNDGILNHMIQGMPVHFSSAPKNCDRYVGIRGSQTWNHSEVLSAHYAISKRPPCRMNIKDIAFSRTPSHYSYLSLPQGLMPFAPPADTQIPEYETPCRVTEHNNYPLLLQELPTDHLPVWSTPIVDSHASQGEPGITFEEENESIRLKTQEGVDSTLQAFRRFESDTFFKENRDELKLTNSGANNFRAKDLSAVPFNYADDFTPPLLTYDEITEGVHHSFSRSIKCNKVPVPCCDGPITSLMKQSTEMKENVFAASNVPRN